jgi:glycosyltransferase involved in cell wall biosynthesis
MPKIKLSVCILALNEEKNLKACLESVSRLASEIIVGVDDQTTDKTFEVAKDMATKVFKIKHVELFHVNKQKVVSNASQPWVLWLDADERLDDELEDEIRVVVSKNQTTGYLIPRKNFIFGKWIKHSQFWYPDYQLRLWKKGKVSWPCESIHEDPVIEGKTQKLQGHLIHRNYTSVDQYLRKLMQYTSLDAKKRFKEFKPPYKSLMISRPIEDFIKHFVSMKGYRDGLHGLVLSLLQAFYELIVVVKVWEMNKFKTEEGEFLGQVEKQSKRLAKTYNWWKREIKIKETGNQVVKIWNKGLRKLGF